MGWVKVGGAGGEEGKGSGIGMENNIVLKIKKKSYSPAPGKFSACNNSAPVGYPREVPTALLKPCEV